MVNRKGLLKKYRQTGAKVLDEYSVLCDVIINFIIFVVDLFNFVIGTFVECDPLQGN